MANLHCRSLKERLCESEECLPFKLRDRANRWVMERTVAENFCHLTRHIDVVYNYFLIEKTLVKRLRALPTELVKVSRSLLSSMLILTRHRHRQGRWSNDLPWLVGSNAIILASSRGLCCTDSVTWTSARWSSRARTFALIAQQATSALRFSTL